MKKQMYVVFAIVVLGTSVELVFAMDRPSAPPPTPRDGIPAVMTPISAREVAMLLAAPSAKEQGCRHVLGLDDVCVLTQEGLDAARDAKIAEIGRWTVQHFIELKIANLHQQGGGAEIQARIASLTALLQRVKTKNFLLGDREKITEIVAFYKRLLPIQIRHAHAYLSRRLGGAAAAAATVAGYVADDDEA